MRKPNVQLKQAKLVVEEQRLTQLENQYQAINTKISSLIDRITKKQKLVHKLKNEIADSIGTVSIDDVEVPDSVS